MSKRGWVSPDGELVEVPADKAHRDIAADLLEEHYKDWNWQEDQRFQTPIGADLALESKGWLRAAWPYGFSLAALEGPALSAIVELVTPLKPDRRLVIEVRGKSPRVTIQTTVAEFLEMHA